MVSDCNDALKIRGKISYELTDSEKASTVFRRSLFAVRDIAKGEIFTSDNVRSIRPANGLAPRYLLNLAGKKADRPIRFGTPLSADLVQGGLSGKD
jgi:sialic acid synthase SpsE